MKYTPHPYQEHITQHILDNTAAGVFVDMGLGKTVATLTAIDALINDAFEVSRVVVIAPKRVAEDTWSREIEKWDHLRHLRIVKVLGTERERKEALRQKADIYVINRENVAWLVGLYTTAFPFDMVVIDELSSFKSSDATRFRALRRIRPQIKRVVGLTGTPAPNGLLDLWPQLYLLDMGQRLGTTVTGYRERYFTGYTKIGSFNTKYREKKETADRIYELIGDICVSMKAADYLDLPERIDNTVAVPFTDELRAQYERFEEIQVLKLLEAPEITAVNAAAMTNKLLQFCNGAVYDDEKKPHTIHNEKLDALAEVIEAANGKPVLVFYSFRHDLERITQRFKAMKPVVLIGSKEVAAWNAGKVPLMLAHPASAGHGLNLQDGGNIIAWYGLPWSLELYMQAVARLHRQGQTQVVVNNRLVIPGTVEDDVMKALDRKAGTQDALLEAIKARIAKVQKRLKTHAI